MKKPHWNARVKFADAVVHMGLGRWYICPECPKTIKEAESTQTPRMMPQWCDDGTILVQCPYHHVWPVKRKWLTATEKMAKSRAKSFFELRRGEVLFIKDVAKVGTATCQMCHQKIAKGEPRLGFDWLRGTHLGGNMAMPSGAYVPRTLWYVHRSCFIDKLFDGKPGQGCPGCSLKISDREFREYKKKIQTPKEG